jgi:hypothetical protein
MNALSVQRASTVRLQVPNYEAAALIVSLENMELKKVKHHRRLDVLIALLISFGQAKK